MKARKRRVSESVRPSGPSIQSVKAIVPPGLTIRAASAINRFLSTT